MDREALNYIRRMVGSPMESFRYVPYYFSFAKRKIFEREDGGTRYYPENVASVCMDIKGKDADSIFNASYLAFNGDLRLSEAPPDNSLMLADGVYRFDDLPDWHERFDDTERTESLHRWIWLLKKFAESPSVMLGQWGVRLMTDWVLKMKDRNCAEAWNTYTAGERICNGLMFLSLTGRNAADNSLLVNELRKTAYYVAENLEYKYGGVVFNHIINNARALYFSGVCFNIMELKTLSKTILDSEVNKLIKADGFLREGSSYYQFLVARWLLEIYYLAGASGDRDFESVMSGIARNAVKQCWFFMVHNPGVRKWEMPLIGDVSPDFTPEWLFFILRSSSAVELYHPENIPVKPKKRGWPDIFPSEDTAENIPCGCGIFGGRSFQAYPESGWFRLDLGAFTVFWHIEPTGSPMFPSHAHCDTGSFVLYVKGELFLMDPGRFIYMDNDDGRYGVSARAHNSLVIDGMEPFVYKSRTRYPDSYRRADPAVGYSWTDTDFVLTLRHNGFGRIAGDEIICERIFRVSTHAFELEDIVSGRKEHDIETFFQWGTAVKLSEADGGGRFMLRGFDTGSASFHLKCDNIKALNVNSGVNEGFIKGWFYPSYGRKEPAATLTINQRAKLPMKNKYVLSLAR